MGVIDRTDGDRDAAVLDLLDLARYPWLSPDRRPLIIQECREAMASDGCVMLPGFVTAAAAAHMAEEAMATLPHAFRRDTLLGAYEQPAEDWMPPTHPRRRRHPYCMHVTATDRLAQDGAILRLYRWDGLTRLIAEILGEPALYRVADPLLRCAVTVMSEGDQHGWHFDGNDFVITLLLQAAETGGAFEFAPGIRTADDENFDAVAAVMDGKSQRVKRPSVDAGTLMLFRGKDSLHRVSPVAGSRPRVIAVFSYDRQPEMNFPDHVRLQAVGRRSL